MNIRTARASDANALKTFLNGFELTGIENKFDIAEV